MVRNQGEPTRFADRVAQSVRDALAELCAVGFATVQGPRNVEGVERIDVEATRSGAACMQVEVYDDPPPSLALNIGEHGMFVELIGSEPEMLDELRELVVGIASHGYEEWIHGRSDLGVAGLAYVRTPDGRRRTISNNVAPWAGWLRRPRGEPRRYLPYSTVTPGDS